MIVIPSGIYHRFTLDSKVNILLLYRVWEKWPTRMTGMCIILKNRAEM
jgi:cupin superfamily acireductone dioxygenase involved in methionine salvage